jgi:hypothetical protein
LESKTTPSRRNDNIPLTNENLGGKIESTAAARYKSAFMMYGPMIYGPSPSFDEIRGSRNSSQKHLIITPNQAINSYYDKNMT